MVSLQLAKLVEISIRDQNRVIGERREPLLLGPSADLRGPDREPQMTEKLISEPGAVETSPSTHFSVVMAADINSITPVLAWIMRLVSELEYPAEKDFEIELALHEALANAVMHGCKADPAKKIECHISADKSRGILIVVRDPGPGFDMATIPSPTERQNLFSEHGRGIYLINQLMDEVKYEHNGSEIQMRKF
jgi:serine/threonine-protein kinase RsbW